MISLLCQDAQGRGSVGGAWQSFCYDEQCQVWIRSADVRHALSTLFTPSFYDNEMSQDNNSNNYEIENRNENSENDQNGRNGRIENTDNRWIEKLRNGAVSTSFSTSLEGQQSVAARWSGISLSEVLDIARLGLNQDNNSQNYTSNQSKTPLNQGTQMLDWSAMVTASYLEEKIVLSYAVGTVEEASEWVAQWCRSNCLVSNERKSHYIQYLCLFSFILLYFILPYSIFMYVILSLTILFFFILSYCIFFDLILSYLIIFIPMTIYAILFRMILIIKFELNLFRFFPFFN
jgi:hypothetical protein